MQHIKLGTTLQRGKYRVEAVIGEGGFGNTYMATNCENGQRIAIKEFFWRGVTERDDMTGKISVSDISLYEVFKQQKEKFRKEAARLQQFNNPHIVRVYDQFEENGTAYYVMDFIDGESLSEKMKRTGLPLTEQEVRELLPQMLDALKCVHDAGLLHLDLKPGNLMVDKQGNVKLIDFGASKQLDTQRGGATAKTRQTYTNGYAPREQMDENFSKYGPWTDLYALGATLYCLLTKRRPPMPLDLDDDESDDKHIALPFPENISEDTKSLIRWMMNTNRSRRPQSVSEMMGFANTTSQQSSHHYSNYSETTFFSGQIGNERTQATTTHHQNNEETHFSQSQSINEQTIASQQNWYNSYNQNAYNNTTEENHYYRNQKPSSNNGMVVFFILFGIILTLGIIVYTSKNSIPSQVDPIDIADTSIVDDYALQDTFAANTVAAEPLMEYEEKQMTMSDAYHYIRNFISEGNTFNFKLDGHFVSVTRIYQSADAVNIEVKCYESLNSDENYIDDAEFYLIKQLLDIIRDFDSKLVEACKITDTYIRWQFNEPNDTWEECIIPSEM